MGRKKNVPGKNAKAKEDSFDEEAAIEIYGKRNFEPPVNKGLETVLELPEDIGEQNENCRARASKAKLMPKMRVLASQPYFIQDKEKDALRRKQTAKLFKGRKKPRWQGLSAKQESALLDAISSKPETDDEESDKEDEDEESKHQNLMPFLVTDSPSEAALTLRLSSGTSSSFNDEKQMSFHTPVSSFSEAKNGEKKASVSSEEEDDDEVFSLAIDAVIQKTIGKPQCTKNNDRPSEVVSSSVSSTDNEIHVSAIDNVVQKMMIIDENNQSPAISKEHLENIMEADGFLGPLGFDDDTDTSHSRVTRSKRSGSGKENNVVISKAHIENILEADEFLGPLGFDDDEEEEAVPSKKRIPNDKENDGFRSANKRQSKLANVRRSSRFFAPLAEKHQNSCLGSIFTEVEIVQRKQLRRSKLFVKPNLQLLAPKRPSSPIEEAMKLITNEPILSWLEWENKKIQVHRGLFCRFADRWKGSVQWIIFPFCCAHSKGSFSLTFGYFYMKFDFLHKIGLFLNLTILSMSCQEPKNNPLCSCNFKFGWFDHFWFKFDCYCLKSDNFCIKLSLFWLGTLLLLLEVWLMCQWAAKQMSK